MNLEKLKGRSVVTNNDFERIVCNNIGLIPSFDKSWYLLQSDIESGLEDIPFREAMLLIGHNPKIEGDESWVVDGGVYLWHSDGGQYIEMLAYVSGAKFPFVAKNDFHHRKTGAFLFNPEEMPKEEPEKVSTDLEDWEGYQGQVKYVYSDGSYVISSNEISAKDGVLETVVRLPTNSDIFQTLQIRNKKGEWVKATKSAFKELRGE